MELLKEKIRAQAGSVYPEMTVIRRHLHQHPELSKHEFEIKWGLNTSPV